MSRHEDIRDALLGADLDELRGIGESVVARAVRSDAQVRADAEAILRSTSAMHAALDSVAVTCVAAAVAPAGSTELRSAPSAVTTAGPQFRRPMAPGRRPSLSRVWMGAGALAAAAIAAVLLMDGASVPEPDQTTPVPPLTATLDAESDRPFGVFATDNPDIAIVWLFPKEGE